MDFTSSKSNGDVCFNGTSELHSVTNGISGAHSGQRLNGLPDNISASGYHGDSDRLNDGSYEQNTLELRTDQSTNNQEDSKPVDHQLLVERLHRLNLEETERGERSCNALNGYCNGEGSNDSDNSVVSIDDDGITYVRYKSEFQMQAIMSLISKDLSEPYSIYTYRYFIHNWPNLCFLAMDGDNTVGAIVCKIDQHKRTLRSRGYIGMLAVDHEYRRKKIGSKLVRIAIESMIKCAADEIVLETEVTNAAALNLYERLGFIRDKKLHRYYLNGVDAIRLKLWIT